MGVEGTNERYPITRYVNEDSTIRQRKRRMAIEPSIGVVTVTFRFESD